MPTVSQADSQGDARPVESSEVSVSGNKQPGGGEAVAPGVCVEDKVGSPPAAGAPAAGSHWRLYDSKYFKDEAPGETDEHG